MSGLECAVCTLSESNLPADWDPSTVFVTTERWGTVCRVCMPIAEDYLEVATNG